MTQANGLPILTSWLPRMTRLIKARFLTRPQFLKRL
jgi:hypothetical protein